MSEPLRDGHLNTLLQRLGPDPDLAGTRYEQLRRRLISLFSYRRCPYPEELADETLDRAARRLEEIGAGFVGSDPTRFVYGVAWNVARESFRRRTTEPLPDRWEHLRATPPPQEAEEERARACLDRCLARLAAEEQSLVLGYFEGEGGERIERRSALARQLGLSPNALRLRIHRLTDRLRECVVRCVEGWGRAGAEAAP